LKARIQSARISLALGWGEAVNEQLAKDLQKAFPWMRGFSTANLWAMRRVYVEYGRDPIIQRLAEELEMKKGAAFLEEAEEAV
jgi:hypothetical protein